MQFQCTPLRKQSFSRLPRGLLFLFELQCLTAFSAIEVPSLMLPARVKLCDCTSSCAQDCDKVETNFPIFGRSQEAGSGGSISLELLVLGLGLHENGDIGISVFPESEKILI